MRRTIVGVVGAITGYAAGHAVASRYDTDCDSTLVPELLDKTALWVGFENARVALTMRELASLEEARLSRDGNVIFAWEEDPAFRCSTALRRAAAPLETYLTKTIDDQTSADFKLLDDIKTLHDRVVETPEYRTLLELRLYRAAADISEAGEHLAVARGDAARRWDEACEALDRLTPEPKVW